MRTDDFDYDLPPELVAQVPAARREDSRLLVLERARGRIEHKRFADLVGYIRRGDTVVLNDSLVIPARLRGRREDTGGVVEFLLVRRAGGELWEVLARPGKRARPGAVVSFGAGRLVGRVIAPTPFGGRLVQFESAEPFMQVLAEIGEIPLPPYIKGNVPDRSRYQTVYAREPGSVAAPTAGLHFTEELLDEIKARGARLAFITLHVGPGTFRPVRQDDPRKHRMEEEWFSVGEDVAAAIADCRRQGGRVIAVGSTAARALETAAVDGGLVAPQAGFTTLFVYPGYTFRSVDALITNFHQPRSTLLMLVSAFAGRELVLHAYREAIRMGYRFFSFGDAMFII